MTRRSAMHARAAAGSVRVGTLLATILFCALAAAPLRANESVLAGPWETLDGDVVEIVRDGTEGPWLGRLAVVTPGSRQLGYSEGQVVLRNLALDGAQVRFERAVRSINPIEAKRCGAVFVPFAGAYVEDDAGTIRLQGRQDGATFELPWDAGEPCETARQPAAADGQLTRLPRRDFALDDVVVQGAFECEKPAAAAPFAPYAEVTAGGRFRVFLPSAYFPAQGENNFQETNVTAQIFVRDPTAAAWTAIGAAAPLRLLRCPRPTLIEGYGNRERADPSHFVRLASPKPEVSASAAAFPADLDISVANFWEQLNEGDRDREFRVRLTAPAIGGEAALAYDTPVFTKDDLFRALGRRLDREAGTLLRLSLARFEENYRAIDDGRNATRYEDARERLWHGFHVAATQLYASVELLNHSQHNDRHPVVLILSAKLTDGRAVELDRQSVVLGAARAGDSALLNIPLESRATIDFTPVPTDGSGRLAAADLARLEAFEIRAEPAWAGGAGRSAAARPVNGTAIAAAAPFLRFGARLDAAASRFGGAPWERRAVGMALRRWPGEPQDPWMEYAGNSAELFLQEQFDAFVRLHKIYVAFDLATGGTALDQLDRHVRGLWQNGARILAFYDPRTVPTIGSGDAPSRRTEYELRNSGTRVFWSSVSALLNPNLSFAMDPSLLTVSSDAAATPAPRGRDIAGLTRWGYPSGLRTDETFALRLFHGSPDMQEAYRHLTGGRGDHARLSLVLANELRNGDYDGTRGRLFEELTVKPVLMQEAVRLADERDDAGRRKYSDIIVLDGSQIYGLGIKERGTRAGELTDGMVLGRRDGRWHLLRIAEAKAGTAGAQDLFDQFHSDANRLLNLRVRLQRLTAEQKRLLGTDADTIEFDRVGAAGGLRVDFTDPALFVPLVVSNAEIELPRAAPDEPARTRAIRRAMEESVRRSALNEVQIQSLTDLLFQQAGVKPVRWSERHLDFDAFVKLTKRSLGDRPMPDDTELERRFANGERVRPDDGEWQRVFEPWEQPVRSPAQVVQDAVEHWKRNHNGQEPSAAQLARWKEDAAAGKRFNPNSADGRGSWPGLGTLNAKYRAFILDPADPTLSDAEKRIWVRLGSDIPESEQAAFLKRLTAAEEVYDATTRTWRAPSDKERSLRILARDHPDLARLYDARVRHYETKADVAERALAAFSEGLRVYNERLLVYVSHTSSNVHVNVVPELVLQDGSRKRIDLPQDSQRALLRRFYRFSESMFFEREPPPWLR